jgi:hypothetical protein
MVDQLPSIPTPTAAAADDALADRERFMRLFREGVQREVAEQLAAGLTIYSGGTGAEEGKLFIHTPDGRRFEYRVREDGTREIVRELPGD